MNGTWFHRFSATLVVVSVVSAAVRAQDKPTSRPGSTPEGPPSGARVDEPRPPASLGEAGRGRSAAEPPAPVVREPSQGRPIFIMPEGTFYFVMRLAPDVQGDVNFTLVHALERSIRVPLVPGSPPSFVNDDCMIVLKVPATAKPGLYDIEVRSKRGRHFGRRCVKVVDAFKTRFRFVHLSNMNVGDLTAPDFDEMLPNEINLLAPEFIIATGDYTEWARTRNDASSWKRVLAFFEKFNAPVFMLCGLRDHEASFSKYVASKPIDRLDYGSYHGLLLLDHAGSPIDQDYSQLQWVDADLKRNRNKTFNFIATHSDELALLDIWRERGGLAAFVKEHKIKMFIVGGSTDWDYKEFADKVAGLEDFHLIRTHQSSTCLRDRATGVSHFRVIEVDGDKIEYVYPDDNAVAKAAHSIPTGRLRAFLDGPNDGTAGRVGITVQNALNQAFDNCRVWLRVAKDGDRKPTVAPGRLVRAFDAGSHWACDVAFDLPDKGAVRIVASTDPANIPPRPPIDVALDGPTDWSFTPASTDFGLSYFSCDAKVAIKLTNRSDRATVCWPVIRVNGQKLHPDRSVFPRMPIEIDPGKTVSVPVVLNLRRVSTGKHVLQVHFLEDPLSRLNTFEVSLSHAE